MSFREVAGMVWSLIAYAARLAGGIALVLLLAGLAYFSYCMHPPPAGY